MEREREVLLASPLFTGMSGEEVESALGCLDAHRRGFQGGEVILAAGDQPLAVGIILEGTAQIYRDEADGRRAILTELTPGDLFAEALVSAGVQESPVTVEAVTAVQALFLPFSKFLSPDGGDHCAVHKILMRNMLVVLGKKNLHLTEKINLLTKGSIRQRLLAYFYSLGGGEPELDIPFTREQLADYLSANRSAMTRELGSMQREGILSLSGRHVMVHRWS